MAKEKATVANRSGSASQGGKEEKQTKKKLSKCLAATHCPIGLGEANIKDSQARDEEVCREP